MNKIITRKYDKIWGYEIWVYSPIKGQETTFESGEKNTQGPLVKIIKTTKPLSVQVHPDDKLANLLEGEKNGKSESWFILDSKPESNLVMGLKGYGENIIREKLANGTFKEMLNYVNVKNGDFFNIPAGLIHGIGAGLTILEVQQPSDITYRYYDYDRLENGKPRELHVDKAIKSQKELDWELSPISTNPLKYKNSVGSQTYMCEPTTLNEKSIIINLDTYDSYVAEKCEMIDFPKYVIVSF